jgi:hypothetical protein
VGGRRREAVAGGPAGPSGTSRRRPTNHLDLPAIEPLESALAGFDGTLLLVSHDRRLLESVATDRSVATGGG